MEFLTAGISLAGVGLSLFGSMQQAKIAKEEAMVSKEVAQADMDVNQQKYTMEQLNTQRMQLENIRNAQRARSVAQTTAVSQGAQFGTALPGAYGQISGQEGTNFLRTSENQQIGTAVFGLDQFADTLKMRMADLGGKMADAQGLTAIGGAVSKSAGPLGNLFGGAGNALGNLFGGGASA